VVSIHSVLNGAGREPLLKVSVFHPNEGELQAYKIKSQHKCTVRLYRPALDVFALELTALIYAVPRRRFASLWVISFSEQIINKINTLTTKYPSKKSIHYVLQITVNRCHMLSGIDIFCKSRNFRHLAIVEVKDKVVPVLD
jgi:hypothetical protein